MTQMHEIVFLFDVDNTLLDNDQIIADLHAHLAEQFGQRACDDYWEIFEQLRQELGYADYLGALQRYRLHHLNNPRMLRMSSFLINYPFADRIFPGALDGVAHCAQWGQPVILSDGDVVFQPHKVDRSGLWDVFEGHVLIYIHKEHDLLEVAQRYPAQHYVMIDDKLRILAALKQALGDRVTTVFPRQGHYALDPEVIAHYPQADITLASIADLNNLTRNDFYPR